MLALSANSPYLAGRATGLASNRAEVLAQLPRAGAPPAFGSYGAWEGFVERLIGLGLADDYTRFWWDVRPHPRFGTLEIRMPDQPTSLAVTVALSALLQALCASVELEAARPADRGDYAQNRWAALRFGTAAELIHRYHETATAWFALPSSRASCSSSSRRRPRSSARRLTSRPSIPRAAKASTS